MNAVKKSILKRITSFMMAVSMTGSVLIDGQSVFALDSQSKVTVLNNDEHGRFEFVSNENYIDVLKEVSASELNLTSEETESSNEVASNDEASNEELAVMINEDGELETVEADNSSEEDVTTDSEEIATETTVENNETVQVVDPDSKIISKGETVVLNAIADEGYSVESIYVTEEDGDAVRYTFKDNTLSFVMPNEDVTIKSKFSTDVVDVNVDDSVVDNFTYIRSNLNPEYVSLNKWDVADIIYVKNLLVNKKVFDDNGYDVTIDNFNDNDVLYGAMLNFRTNYAFIYDVDANSDYYVSYINFAQNDEEAKVYDYAFARMNDNGEALNGCYFDKNTGIAYIKKSVIDNETVAEGLDDVISTTQIELLIGYDDKDVTHNINVNVEDLTGNVELQSGVIETSLYDNKFEFKLAEDYNNITELKDAKINVVANELSILNGNESDLASYDSSTGVLTVTYDATMLNNINIYVEDSDSNAFDSILSVNAAYYYWADVYKAITNGPHVTISGGTTNMKSYEDSYMGYDDKDGVHVGKHGINPGLYYPDQTPQHIKQWTSYIDKNTATKLAREYHTVINSYNNLDYKSADHMGYASNAGVSSSSGSQSNNALIENINDIFRYELSSGKLKGSGNLKGIGEVPEEVTTDYTYQGSTFRITMVPDGKDTKNIDATYMHSFKFFKGKNLIGQLQFGKNTEEDNFALQCAHPEKASTTKLTDDSIMDKNHYTHFWLNILKVDTTNHKIVYGMVSRADLTPDSTNTQIGVGVFVSNYTPAKGRFNISKYLGNPKLTSSDVTGYYYDANIEYTLKNSSGNTVAIFSNTADHNVANFGLSVKSVSNGATKYTDATIELDPGTYYLAETKVPVGYIPGSYESSSYKDWLPIVIKENETYSFSEEDHPNANTRRNYPVSTDFTAIKVDKLTGKTSKNIDGGKFKLYYFTHYNGKDWSTVQTQFRDALTNSDTTKAINENGKVLPQYVKDFIKTKESDKDFIEVASFTIKDGVLKPTVTHKLFSGSNPDVDYPTVSGNTLKNLPRGIYILIETEAPTGYSIETSNAVPVYYYMNFNYSIDNKANKTNKIRATGVKLLSSTGKDASNKYYTSRRRCYYDSETKTWKAPSTDSEADYTFKAGDYPTVVYGAKSIIDNPSGQDYNLDFMPENFYKSISDNNLQVSTFLKMFNKQYTLSGATYKISVGSTVYATGTTGDDGKITWKVATSAPDSVYVYTCTDNNNVKWSCVAGIPEGTTVKLTETRYSNGTYIGTKESTYKLTGKTYNNISSAASAENKLELGRINVKKRVKLHDDSPLHAGSKVSVTIEKNSTVYTILMAIEDDGDTVKSHMDSHSNATDIYLDFYNACEEDRKAYFEGVAFEVYYNDASNTFPNPTYSNDGLSASLTNTNNTAHVATIEYKLNSNNKVIPTVTTHKFIPQHSKDADNHFYIATGVNSTTASYDAYIKRLPLGYYYVFESKSPTTDIRNGSSFSNRFTLSSNGNQENTRTVTTINASEEVPMSFSLVKQFIKKMDQDQLKAVKNAGYYVYYVPENVTRTFPTNQFVNGVYTGPIADAYLVGEFTTTYNNSKSTIIGLVTNNILINRSHGNWYYINDNGTISAVDLNYIDSSSSLDSRLKTLIKASTNYFGERLNEITSGYQIPHNMVSSAVSDKYGEFFGYKGRYLIVEYSAPDGFGLDQTIHVVDPEGNNIITSREPSKGDPLNINIEKVNNQDNTSEFPLTGTQFTLDFYSDVNIEDVNNFDNSTNTTASLVFEVDENNEINMDSDVNLLEDKSTNYESYVDSRTGRIEFPEGLFIIKETKHAPGYNISKDDNFTVTIDSKEYDLGNTLYVKFVNNARYIYTTDGWKKYNNDTTLNVSIPNTAGEPFSFTKYYADDSGIKTTRFRLTQYKSDKTTAVRDPWVFTVKTDEEYNSLEDPVFASVEGNPLIVGAYYTLEEIDDNGHYILKGSFTYKSDMSVNKMLGEFILGDVNDDGNINIDDALIIQQYENDSNIDINITAADVNADGEINNKDVTYIQRFVAGWEDYDLSLDSNKIINYPEPKLNTIAWDPNTKSHVSYYNGTVKITDTVNVSDVVTGNVYIVEGIAVDVTNPNSPKLIKDANGKYIVGSTAFLATGNDKTTDAIINVEYEFAGNQATLAGKTINFYEYLVLANINDNDSLRFTLQEDSDDDDEDTSKANIYDVKAYRYTGYTFGEIPTAPVLKETTINVASNEDQISSNDTVTLYMAKDTTNVITNPETQLTASAIHINGLIKNTNGSAVSHANANDEHQNIHFPSISTTESDMFTLSHTSGLHLAFSEEDDSSGTYFAVFDTVTINNLKSGDYILTVKVCDQSTGEVLDSYDQDITSNGNATQTFRTNNIIFKDNVERFYITEELYTTDGKLIAIHNDNSVASQQGYIASIGTRAQNKLDNSKLVLAGSQATITDTVSYKNLVTKNHDYYLQGYLVDKSNDKIVATAKKSFNNNTNINGSQNIDFTFNATGLDGKTLVVYEFLYWNNTGNTLVFNVGDTFNEKTMYTSTNAGMILASHYDKGDANQTVYVPKLSTEISGDKKVDPKSSVTITDNVFYNNVLANQKYTIYGYLVDRKNTATESDDTLVATSRKVENLTSTSGTISMSFTFDATKFLDRDIVVYEYMYLGDVTSTFNPTVDAIFNKSGVPQAIGNNRLVGQHADSTDAKQTIHVNGLYVDFLKVDPDGNHIAGAVFRLRNLTTNTTVATWTTTTSIKSQQLSTGDYILEEIDAPDGKTEADSIKFTVKESDDTLKVFYTGTNTELTHTTDSNGSVHYAVNMVDVDLTRLPDAGGIGTLSFTISGLILMLGGVYIANKKKKKLDF